MAGQDQKEGLGRSLFVGEKLFLTPEDLEQDLPVEARWTEDPDYLAMTQLEPSRPLAAYQLRRLLRPPEDAQDQYIFAMRLVEGEHRLIGIVELRNILWTHGFAWLRIRIGQAADRRKGYGSEAARLMLRYAFTELNLHRVAASVYEYNFPAREFLTKLGFTPEVRQRQAVLRFGRQWDLLITGLLRSEWEAGRG